MTTGSVHLKKGQRAARSDSNQEAACRDRWQEAGTGAGAGQQAGKCVRLLCRVLEYTHMEYTTRIIRWSALDDSAESFFRDSLPKLEELHAGITTSSSVHCKIMRSTHQHIRLCRFDMEYPFADIC